MPLQRFRRLAILSLPSLLDEKQRRFPHKTTFSLLFATTSINLFSTTGGSRHAHLEALVDAHFRGGFEFVRAEIHEAQSHPESPGSRSAGSAGLPGHPDLDWSD